MLYAKPANEIQKLENQMYEIYQKITKLRGDSAPQEIKNYTFRTETGDVSLLDMFAGKETLFLIHNMGQGCRYCTMWADGLNGFIDHLESEFAFAMVSKDSPADQRRFANDRGWRFRMASHGGGAYIKEQTVMNGEANAPGIVCYIRKGDKIYRKNSAGFGPGDQYCSFWHIISLAGIDDGWVAQFSYWKKPQKLDDGGVGAIT
jgi:predicted dithiol-disulfide oxidoreductase (DUF899 family)